MACVKIAMVVDYDVSIDDDAVGSGSLHYYMTKRFKLGARGGVTISLLSDELVRNGGGVCVCICGVEFTLSPNRMS